MPFLQYYAFGIKDSNNDAFSRRCLRGCICLMERLSGRSDMDGAGVGAGSSNCQSRQLIARRKTAGRKTTTSSQGGMQTAHGTETTSVVSVTEYSSVSGAKVNKTRVRNPRKGTQKKSCSDFVFYK